MAFQIFFRGPKKFQSKHQTLTGISWNTRVLHLHFFRERKQQAWNSTPHYKRVNEKFSGKLVVKVIDQFFGPAFSAAGIEYVFCDNDTKSHMKMVKEAWARWGIDLWPAGGRSAWDRAIGGYPVDRPDLNHLDQSVHASWKTRRGGLYDRW